MTVVVAFKHKNKAVMLADSRATSKVVEDKLQKLLPLAQNAVLGYASDDVELVARVFKRAKKAARNNNFSIQDFQDIASEEHKGKDVRTIFLMGITSPKTESVHIYSFSSPSFKPTEVVDGFEVVGSGSVIKKYLIEEEDKFRDNDIKEIADKLVVTTGNLLGKHVYDNTVGGMLQALVLEPSGIRPLRHGFVDVDPDEQPLSKGIEMTKGEWKQFDFTNKTKSKLYEPEKLLKISRKRHKFHNFEPPKDYTAQKWHLQYFITCLQAKHKPGLMEFSGISTLYGKHNFPIKLKLLCCIGFWGSPGKHELSVWLNERGKRKKLHSEKISIEYLPQIIDVSIPVETSITSPGEKVLECRIDDFLLGRRPLYLHKIKVPPNKSDNINAYSAKVNKEIQDITKGFTDEKVEKSGKAEVVYFFLCNEHDYNKSHLKLKNQFLSVYWHDYPLTLKTQIVSAFRLPVGEHNVRVELVDAISGETNLIDTATVKVKSSFLVTPIHDDSRILIPKPSIYFANVMIDKSRVASYIFAAETEKAKYSYSLLPEAQKKVKNGELFSLVRGAPNT